MDSTENHDRLLAEDTPDILTAVETAQILGLGTNKVYATTRACSMPAPTRG